jgi:quercetin dioxygenase-like cupin family protein
MPELNSSPVLTSWSETHEHTVSPSVRKSTIEGRGASLTRIFIAAGTCASRHAHPFEQFVQVISGSGTLETENGTQSFSAGCVFHFLPDTWHAATFEDDTVLIETNLAPSGCEPK